MPFAVVLDTCVLYPAHLRDTLLRLAERGLYRVLWSADIVDELRHNLVESGFDPVSINQLIVEMGKAFPDAEVVGYHALIDGLECDSKDLMSSADKLRRTGGIRRRCRASSTRCARLVFPLSQTRSAAERRNALALSRSGCRRRGRCPRGR